MSALIEFLKQTFLSWLTNRAVKEIEKLETKLQKKRNKLQKKLQNETQF